MHVRVQSLLCMSICINVCVCVYAHVFLSVFMRVCVACMCVCRQQCVIRFLHVCVRVRFVHAISRLCVCVCVCVCVFAIRDALMTHQDRRICAAGGRQGRARVPRPVIRLPRRSTSIEVAVPW